MAFALIRLLTAFSQKRCIVTMFDNESLLFDILSTKILPTSLLILPLPFTMALMMVCPQLFLAITKCCFLLIMFYVDCWSVRNSKNSRYGTMTIFEHNQNHQYNWWFALRVKRWVTGPRLKTY